MNEQLTQIYGYLHGMWRYRWSALVIAWIVALVGWSIALSLPNQFSANAVVYIDTSSVLKPLLKGLAPETDAFDELQVMTRVLLSRENLMSVVRETDMDLEAETAADRDEIVMQLADSITITGGSNSRKRNAKSNIYEISYQSHSSNRSYQVVSNLLNTMIEDTLNSTRTDTASAQKFLDSQIVIYEERLSKAEQKLAAFKKQNIGYMPDERGGYYMRLQNGQDSVEETNSDLRLAERRYTELTRQLKGESLVLSKDGYLSGNAKKIKNYQAQLEILLNQYTPRHPDVLALQASIENLKTLPDVMSSTSGDATISDSSTEFNPVYQEVKVDLSKASVEVEMLKIKLVEQKAYVKKMRASIDVIPEVEAKLAKLNRGYEVKRERYLDLVERRESAQLAQNAGQSSSDITFRVIEPPIVPFKPSGPSRVLYLVAALFVALGAGLAWSLLRYLFQPTFINLTQLSAAVGLPVLGSVSLYLSPEHRKRRRVQLTSFVSAALMLVLVFSLVFVMREPGVVLLSSVMVNK